MVQAQGFEGPSVGWNDSQPTFAIHQEGDFAVLRPPLEGDIENGFGIPQQPVHTILIARARKGMNRQRTASDNPIPAIRIQKIAEGGRRDCRRATPMGRTVPVIGVEPSELRWIRMLIFLLRHPDPSMPELARQALLYLMEAAAKRAVPPANQAL